MELFLSKPGWDKSRKREKNFRLEFRSYPTRARKFQKKKKQKNSKNYKTSFRQYFYPNRVLIGREREKKIFVPNSVPARLGLENSKKIAKKFKQLKNIILALFLSKPGWDRPRKRDKKFCSKFHSYLTRARKFPKKIAKKIQKHHSSIVYIQTRLTQVEKERKKKWSQIPFLPDLGKNILKKLAKKFKKLKKHHSSIISIQTGLR